MPDKTRIDFGEENQSFTWDAPLRTQFREFLGSRGILTREPEGWDSAESPKSVETVYMEIAEQSKGISQADGDALIGEFLKWSESQNKG